MSRKQHVLTQGKKEVKPAVQSGINSLPQLAAEKLKSLNKQAFPYLHERVSSPVGLQTTISTIVDLCSEHGCNVQTAIGIVENTLMEIYGES